MPHQTRLDTYRLIISHIIASEIWRLSRFLSSIGVAYSFHHLMIIPARMVRQSHELLLLFDLGSQLPPGCWVSTDAPGLREIKLSVFHAFWHPGALDWPLRGAPEVLQIPGELLHNNLEIQDFGDALAWSLVSVQRVKLETQEKLLNQLDTAAKIQEDLIHVGLESMRHQMKNVPHTVKDVQDGVVAWLRNSPVCYEHHQPGEQVTARLSGYAAPTFGTPAAGLLLPIVGEARTVRNGVLVGDNRYIAEGINWKPGSLIPYRAFPYIYDGAHPEERMVEAIFVGHGDDLTFLTRERER